MLPPLLKIASSFKGVLLDAYGVFWGGSAVGPFPGAPAAMEALVSKGHTVGILSNSTQLAEKEIDKIGRAGLVRGRHFHFLMTSGEVTRRAVLEGRPPFAGLGKKFWLHGAGHTRHRPHEAIFADSTYAEVKEAADADFIYVGVPHVAGRDTTDVSHFRESIDRLITSRLPMVCANPDRFAHDGSPPRAIVCQGSIARLYEEAGGDVHYIGKPHAPVYQAAMEQFALHDISDRREVLMVGDNPETDIRGARAFGMNSMLITQTGIMSDAVAKVGLDEAVANIQQSDRPDYFIRRLALDAV